MRVSFDEQASQAINLKFQKRRQQGDDEERRRLNSEMSEAEERSRGSIYTLMMDEIKLNQFKGVLF